MHLLCNIVQSVGKVVNNTVVTVQITALVGGDFQLMFVHFEASSVSTDIERFFDEIYSVVRCLLPKGSIYNAGGASD